MTNENKLEERISKLEQGVQSLRVGLDIAAAVALSIIVHLTYGNRDITIAVFIVVGLYAFFRNGHNR